MTETRKPQARRPASSKPRRDQEDLLSPGRALRLSVGATGSQRVGDSGPIANPEVSFPEEPTTPGRPSQR